MDPLHCRAQMLGQPLLQPDSVKGRGGIHRYLPKEDQHFGGTLMTCLTPDAWWSGYHPQTSPVLTCCESALLQYPSGMCWGLLDTAKFTMLVLERLTCCHLLQRALPGSSWQERLLGQQHPGQAHHSRPAEHRSIFPAPRASLPPAAPSSVTMMSSQIPPLSPSPASGSCRPGQSHAI